MENLDSIQLKTEKADRSFDFESPVEQNKPSYLVRLWPFGVVESPQVFAKHLKTAAVAGWYYVNSYTGIKKRHEDDYFVVFKSFR